MTHIQFDHYLLLDADLRFTTMTTITITTTVATIPAMSKGNIASINGIGRIVTTENRYKGQRIDEFDKGEKNMIKIALETIKRLDST
ncbi:MAG: hypothetical protein KGD60_11880 [Candidatus Thorarchaeota archaeon]|nr:hypothetical protein [Candidatus Thorarchaeota archaeon]